MLILEILFGLITYLFIGNLLGHVMVKEFLDNTETEKLNWGGKLRRSLLFPYLVFKNQESPWERRAEFIDYGPIRNNLTECNLASSRFINYSPNNQDKIEKGKDECIKKHTWFWPLLRLVPAFAGVIYMIIYTGSAIAQFISIVFFRNER